MGKLEIVICESLWNHQYPYHSFISIKNKIKFN